MPRKLWILFLKKSQGLLFTSGTGLVRQGQEFIESRQQAFRPSLAVDLSIFFQQQIGQTADRPVGLFGRQRKVSGSRERMGPAPVPDRTGAAKRGFRQADRGPQFNQALAEVACPYIWNKARHPFPDLSLGLDIPLDKSYCIQACEDPDQIPVDGRFRQIKGKGEEGSGRVRADAW